MALAMKIDRIDWTKFVSEQSRVSGIFQTDRLAKQFGMSERLVWDALKRQSKKGLVRHFGKKIFINNLAHDFSGRELVTVLRPNSYISLESALREWGISSQTPIGITSVTTGEPGTLGPENLRIHFKHISPRLFWGFKKHRTRYGQYDIAEPEKALLDWIYLQRRRGATINAEELDVSSINGGKLLSYSEKFPRPVKEQALSILASSLSGKNI